jgi:hypothetical protein
MTHNYNVVQLPLPSQPLTTSNATPLAYTSTSDAAAGSAAAAAADATAFVPLNPPIFKVGLMTRQMRDRKSLWTVCCDLLPSLSRSVINLPLRSESNTRCGR